MGGMPKEMGWATTMFIQEKAPRRVACLPMCNTGSALVGNPSINVSIVPGSPLHDPDLTAPANARPTIDQGYRDRSRISVLKTTVLLDLQG